MGGSNLVLTMKLLLLSYVSQVESAKGNTSMDDFDGGGGMFAFPSFDFEMHMQESMGVLGVMSCLADEADSELEMMSMTMGGILGAIFGQAQGKDAPNQGAFVEAGGLAGIAGAASGLLKYGEKQEDLMPDPAVVARMWSQDPGDNGAPLKVMESMMSRSKNALKHSIHDVNAIVDEMQDKIKSLIKYGTNAKIAYAAAGAGHLAGQIADIAKRASFKSLNQKEMLEMFKKATPVVLQALKVIKKGNRDSESLSDKEMNNLIKDSFNIGGSMGLKGAEREDRIISDIHAAVAMSPFYVGPLPKVSSRNILEEKLSQDAKTDEKAKEVLNTCVRGVMPIIDEIEELGMLISPEMEYLDWAPLFHVDDDVSYSKSGLPKYISGDRYNDEWDFKPLPEVTLPGNLKASEFDNSFVPDILKDPALVDLIKYASRTQNNALVEFLKGKTSVDTLSAIAFQMLPAVVLEHIPDKEAIPLDSLIEFMKQDRSDLEDAAEVFGNLSAARQIELFETASEKFYSGEFLPDPKFIHMVQDLFQDDSEESEFFSLFNKGNPSKKISNTCPFGLSATVLETIEEDLPESFDDINRCIEAMGGKVKLDTDAFQFISNTVSSSATSASDLLNLKYMINFGSISISLNQTEIEKLAQSKIDEYLVPSLPSFVRTAQTLVGVIINDINDTDAIASSGLISCGLVSRIVDESLKGVISKNATKAAVKSCRNGLSSFVKSHPKQMESHDEDDTEPSDMQKLMKFLRGSKERHLPDGPDSMMKFWSGDLRSLISDNPEELDKFRPIDTAVAISKIKDDLQDFLSKHDQYRSLATKIPVSMLEDLDVSDESFKKKLTAIKWHQQQALRLNEEMQDMTVHDIRKMGHFAVGLTCLDVKNMDIDLILHIARALAFQIGDTITSDLAECIATKIFLHLQSRYPGKKHLAQKLDAEVPNLFTLFFPADIVAELPHCARFYSKLTPHVHRLFPSPVARLYLEDFATYAIECFSSMGDAIGDGPFDYGENEPNDLDDNFPNGYPNDKPEQYPNPQHPQEPDPQHPQWPDQQDSQNPNPKDPQRPMPVRKRRNAKMDNPDDKDQEDMPFSGNDDAEESEKDKFFGDIMNRVPNQYFKSIGPLICYVKSNFVTEEDEDTCKAMMKAMRGCIPQISNQTLTQIHRKLVSIYENPQNWNSEILTEIGPFVATLPDTMLQMIPAEAFLSAFDAIKPPPQKTRDLTGDMTTAVLDVVKILNLPSFNGSGPPIIDAAFSPFNYQDFYKRAVEKMLPKSPSAEDIKKLGPDSLPYLPLDALTNDHIHALRDMFGQGNVQLDEDKETALKELLMADIENSSNDIDEFSDEDLFSIAKRAVVFSESEIAQYFRFSKVGTLARLGEANWKNADQAKAVLDVYMNNRKYSNLTGPELVAIGNIHCHLDASSINQFNPDSLKFAVHNLGKLRCFDQDHLDTFKEAVASAFGTIDAATLIDMGILAAGFSASELVKFGKPDPKAEPSRMDKDVNLIPAIALRVMPSERIISGFDESQLLRMGTANGGILLQREDVYEKLSNGSKNAVFAAATGLNAGMYATFINHSRTVNPEAMTRLQKEMEDLMEKLNKAFAKVHRDPFDKVGVINTFNVFGLADVSMAKRPEPEELSDDISVTEMKSTFNINFLNDRVMVNMINEITEQHSVMVDIFSGDSTLNDLSDSDWETVPVKMLQGFKRDTIQELSAEKLAALLDSEDVSRDPASLSKVLHKLDLEQFKDALKILTTKMNETEDKNWRPPISIQDVVASSYFRFDHGGKAAAMESFLKYMCPFAAGVDSWQINRLPSEETYIEKMIACFDPSYKDLQSFQRRAIVNWVGGIWKRKDMNAEKAIQLKNFFLDFPIGNIRNVFSYDEVVAYVDSGVILKLDSSHAMFDTIARYITNTIMTSDASKFGDSDFMYKLGKAKCVIKARKIKKSLDAASLKRLLDYNLKSCKDREEELADSLEECTGDASSRLQRCQLLQFEMSKIERKGSFSVSSSFSFSSSFSTSSIKSVQIDRPSIQEYENMKIVMDSFKEESNKALSEFTSSDIRNVASAFGVLKPKEIDQLPADAILENIDVLKNNTNLSRKQKSNIFVKMVSAGFEVTSSESIVELGEFVTSVPPNQFKQLDSAGIQDSLGQLSKHAKEFSRAQKTAIMETLTEADSTNWTTILQQDLGELATEIPLSDLDDVVIEKDNLKEIGKQPWSRGQAANLFRKYRQSAGLADDTLTPDDIRDMGRTSIGVSCKEFMKILDDVSYDAAQALVKETDGSLTYDMNDCVSKKLHYSLQVLNGVDYIANDTGTDLSTTLEYIPGDIAMMMPTDQLEKVPATACMAIMGNIGKAKIDMIPLTGAGMDRRKSLANITMKCIEENRLSDDPIDVSEALTFGRLMCDLEVEHWEKFDLESFIEMFSELRDCFYRLSKEKIKYMLARVLEKYGDSSSWTADILAALGPTIALMEEIVINDIPEDVIYEALDDISPPQLDSELPAHEFVKYDAVYNKFVDSVMSQRESSRRRRQISAPDYDEMVVLGAGNVALTEAQLRAVTDEDFSNALSILGAINNWAMGQMSTLVDKLKSIYGSVETWASKVIKDAQHLIKGLTADELAKLVIDDIETASQMANVNFTNEEKFMLVEAYLKGVGVELTNLSSSELSGFASLACGIVKEKLEQIPDSSITAVLNDLGDLDCFSQEQFDYLKQVAVAGRDSEIPTAPELYEMGTIAAGLSSDDLAALPVDSMSFIKPAAFMKITPSRIRDGLNASQLLAAGAGNVAALMTPEIFDVLTIVQRNALRVAAYGDEAELEDESATEATPTDEVDEVDPDNDDDDGGDGGGDGGDDGTDDTDPGDNAADDEDVTTGVKSSTTKSSDGAATTSTTTTTGSSAAISPSFYIMFFLLIVTTVLMRNRF